jgi:hypothetical protein
MDTSSVWATNGTLDYTGRINEYKDTMSRLFPILPMDYIDTRSISTADALALAHFLRCYPREVIVLDVGTFVGVSAFHFASQSKVLKVISVDPNPMVADEISDKSDVLGSSIDTEPLRSLRVLDVARTTLTEFGDEQKKIQLRAGTVGTDKVGGQGGSFDSLEKVEIPVLEPGSDVSLVAFIDRVHTKEGVRANLEAIFAKNSHAIVLLDDCRGSWGPFVQAGIVSFMENTHENYHFQLFGDLSSSVATSNLGVVYPDINAAEVEQTLVEFRELFTERLDLLRLLRREEELIAAVSLYKDAADELSKEKTILAKHKSRLEQRNSQLEQHKSRLEQRNSQLIGHYSSRRYKLVDTLSERVLQVPGVRKLVRRGRTR